MKKCFSLLLTVVLLANLLVLTQITVNAQGTQGSSPIHLALVMDASGSITDDEHPSDKDLKSRDAAQDLLAILPAGSRVALFEFSNNLKKKADLTAIDVEEKNEKLRSTLLSMKECSGGTHMISALTDVCTYMEENSEEGAENYIVVFTDGAEDGVLNSKNATNELIKKNVSNAISGIDDVTIYSVAYDYLDANGVHSVGDGEDGYGYRILNEFAQQTDGKVFVSTELEGLKDEFRSIFGEIENGQSSEESEKIDASAVKDTYIKKIEIDDVTAEFDISISCNEADSIKNGKIELINPSQNVVDFANKDDNIWYSDNRYSVNIKSISPQSGVWTLRVSDVITSEDQISLNIIHQYDISAQTTVTLDGKNVQEQEIELAVGDTVHIESILYSNGEKTDAAVYNYDGLKAYVYASNDAELAIDTKKMSNEEIEEILKNATNVKPYLLESNGTSYQADITLEHIGANMISVWIYSEKFFCYNQELMVVGDEIFIVDTPKELNIENGTATCLEDIKQYCNSTKATIALGTTHDTNIITASLDNDILNVAAVAPGKTVISLNYTSMGGTSNCTVEVPVTVTNKTPVFDTRDIIYELRAGTELAVSDFKDCISDYENDVITFTVDSIDDEEIVTASFEDDTLMIDGLKKGETNLNVQAFDGTNITTKTIHVVVGHSILFFFGIGFICLIVVIAIIALILFIQNQRKHFNKNAMLCGLGIKVKEQQDESISYHDIRLADGLALNTTFKRNHSITVADILQKIDTTHLDVNEYDSVMNASKDALWKKIRINGSTNKKNPPIISVNHKNVGYMLDMNDPSCCKFGKKKKSQLKLGGDDFAFGIRRNHASTEPDYIFYFQTNEDDFNMMGMGI